MHDKKIPEPNHTAVRVALWRALHVLLDSPPYVFKDEIGLQLVNPDNKWRQRPDMDQAFLKGSVRLLLLGLASLRI